jgi:hypothetical protein
MVSLIFRSIIVCVVYISCLFVVVLAIHTDNTQEAASVQSHSVANLISSNTEWTVTMLFRILELIVALMF